MKKLFLAFITGCVLVVLGNAAVRADTIDPFVIGTGARPLGMGQAFVALADDANASFVNPAGLGSLKEAQITSMYGNLFGDVNYILFSGVYPLEKWGGFGISYLASNAGDLPITSVDSQTGRVTSNGSFAFDSGVIMLSYGKKIDFLPVKDLSVGANLKWFGQAFSNTSGGSANAFNADIGLILKATDWLSLGLTRQNTWPGSWGGQMSWASGTKDSFIPNNKIGLTVKPINWPVLANLDLDVNSRAKLFHLGTEWNAFKSGNLGLSLRAGVQQRLDAASLSKNYDFTFGVGVILAEFGFDYAYQNYYGEAALATHYFSLSYKFSCI